MNMIIALLLLASQTSIHNALTKVVPFQGDISAEQAPDSLVKLVEKVAQTLDYNDNYEVLIPKPAGIELNPFNKFITYARNNVTNNPFVLINPAWLLQLPEDQQFFLIARSLLTPPMSHSILALSIKYLPYIVIGFSSLIFFLFLWLLGKTPLAHQKIWVRILTAYGITLLINLTAMPTLQATITNKLNRIFMHKVHTTVLKKWPHKESAIQALEAYDNAIQKEINQGETFFAPLKNTFSQFIDDLKNTQ